MTQVFSTVSVRKHGYPEEIWLQLDGTWGEYETRRRFQSSTAAEEFADRHGHASQYGLFSNSKHPSRP